MELWENMKQMRDNMRVLVVSYDGWSWLLAWHQCGMKEVVCTPLGDLAREQLSELEAILPGTVIESTEGANLSTNPEVKKQVICVHLSSVPSVAYIDSIVSMFEQCNRQTNGGCFVSYTGTPSQLRAVQQLFGCAYCWQLLRHTQLGGLTTARVWIGWTGFTGIEPGRRKHPKRPLDRFLEPAARNIGWRTSCAGLDDCWYPAQHKPFPWPWSTAPKWVDTPSVFFQHRIQRNLTPKERCQLLDVPSYWASNVDSLWRWNEGASPPLRMLVECILDFTTPIKQVERIEGKGMSMKEEIKFVVDWGRNRAPWTGARDDQYTPQERIVYFGWNWEHQDVDNILVACKKDDAEVDLSLWAVGGDDPGKEEARTTLRNFFWTQWKKRIYREACEWLRQCGPSEDIAINREAIIDCLTRCSNSTWWNWDHGSRLFFWRWPALWRYEARDGAMGFHHRLPRPRLRFSTPPIKEDWILEKDKEKLEKLLRRGYIGPGKCLTTVPRFPVPKGDDDIRVVWDLSKNGVNETMYTPTFFLATMGTYLRRIQSGFYGGDFDVGEQFHNYMLHEFEQPYCGVEVPENLVATLSKEGVAVQRYMCWKRLVFGWQSSPYLALRMFARAIEIAKGSPNDQDNVFGWERIRLNLPGSEKYNPGEPRVMKVTASGVIAADCVTFYDDGRVFAATENQAVHAIRQITSRLQHLGNQDAARKRRPVSQQPGAWAGGVAYTDQHLLRVFIAQNKWDKTKNFLDWVSDQLDEPNPELDRTRFRSGKGFLVYVSQCYEFMQPYLKGFHLSEDFWRSGRDGEGWKLPKNQLDIDQSLEDDDDDLDPTSGVLSERIPDLGGNKQSDHAPKTVKPVPRLREDVRILQMFFAPPTPVQVIVRPVEGSCLVVYGGGDASGEGFGGQIVPAGELPFLRRGFWADKGANESSNWRELRNLIDTLDEEASLGRLVGKEVWLATDNATAAFAYFKGSSSSPQLHAMVTELRLLSLRGNFVLHVYHISGTRMIASGIDALSRGEVHVNSLENCVTTIMPLHLSPSQRCEAILKWLDHWLQSTYKITEPHDWFHGAQQWGEYDTGLASSTWVWDLPPAAALHALEELGNARLKRHNILRGVVLIPQLLSHEWFRRFSRIVDVYFHIPAGTSLGIGRESLLWYRSETRCHRCTGLVTHRQGIFCANFGKLVLGLPICQKAWCGKCYKTLPGSDFYIYRPKDDNGEEMIAPGEENDFEEGRPGDHLFCPFECDYCAFFRLRKMFPVEGNREDDRLLRYIRRANLDAFWSRRPGTIYNLNNMFAEQVAVGESFGFEMFPPMGPFSTGYNSGMKAAIGILFRSTRPGRHEATMKHSSVRKARSLHTDLYNATACHSDKAITWRSEKARFVSTQAPTETEWFNRFMVGFKARVGERRKQDAALSIEVMCALQSTLEEDWEIAIAGDDNNACRVLAEHGAYYLLLFCGSLRGFEGPKVNLGSTRKQIVRPDQASEVTPHIGLALTGRFKARSQHTQTILIHIAYQTASNLQPGIWTDRLITVLGSLGITEGWMFQDSEGEQLRMSYFEEDFYDRLARIYQRHPLLFTEGINISEDFHLARSFRRGATTRATAAGVSAEDIDYINRWNIGSDASVSGPMRVLYSDKRQLIDAFLRFSLAL